LSEADLQQCRAAAERDRSRLSLDDDAVILETVLRQLYKAAADREGAPIADTFDGFKAVINRAEREYLVDAYLDLEVERSPRPETLTQAEYEGLTEEVKKSPNMLLNRSSIALLKKLTVYLAGLPPN
jgi:hypothetical protein